MTRCWNTPPTLPVTPNVSTPPAGSAGIIDRDVIRGREFDFSEKFLPDAISGIDRLDFLNPESKVLLSQIQGRTYAATFALVERFICAKIIEVSRDHFFGDQVALEALIRFSDEELKHQDLFRRIETMIGRLPTRGFQSE